MFVDLENLINPVLFLVVLVDYILVELVQGPMDQTRRYCLNSMAGNTRSILDKIEERKTNIM